ncbi:MAG: succinate dehydrogenase [Dehalococcoidia bacterium]|nr:succinate dehydrogenase [Dehalococcoidia bacterium]HCV00274.1 succinate dehydrogenase [Dehalococcoidia bacterium]|tara:strand:+ start:1295 stop:2095 length:801 start_codon:yes stop_codon:yes gene_type:complete
MAQAVASPLQSGFLATLRQDRWWVEPALVFGSLSLFFGWLTISIFMDFGPIGHYKVEGTHFLTPVYEPTWLSAINADWEGAWYLSPAFIVLVGPVPFRATCYYYRRAYYRSYFLSPPACAVGDLGKSYKGESAFPLIMQNVHRYIMYVALVFVPLLWIGAIRSFHVPGEGWGFGVGSALLILNAFLLMMYTFSCHSLRHFIGGGLNCFSCTAFTRARKRVWDYVSIWNESHRFWAWSSLLGIVLVDVYIRLVANEHITDPNTWSHF